MIEVRNLSYRYPGCTSYALHNLSFDIPDAFVTAIMGSNGSGKSTLARCMNGLLKPTSGEVSVDGMRTTDECNLYNVRRRVGMIFQDPHLQMTSATVERELAFGLENLGVESAEMHNLVDEQLRLFGLEKYRDVSPSSLSGGEQQRLAIASVVLLNPRYLVLDEATSLLSGMSRRMVLELALREKKEKNVSIVLITQFSSEALSADRLIILHAGGILLDDSPGKVFRNAQELLSLGVSVPARSRLEQMQ